MRFQSSTTPCFNDFVAEPSKAGKDLPERVARRIAVAPLAVPLLAGPGPIAIVMIFVNLGYGWLVSGIAILADCVAVWLLRLSSTGAKALDPGVPWAISKVMNLLTGAVGVAFMINGYANAVGLTFHYPSHDVEKSGYSSLNALDFGRPNDFDCLSTTLQVSTPVSCLSLSCDELTFCPSTWVFLKFS